MKKISIILSLLCSLVLVNRSNAQITLGTEFQVNVTTTDHQRNPAVAVDSIGNSFIVWENFENPINQYGIYARRFDSSGAALSGEFLINTSYNMDGQRFPDIAMNKSGNTAVVWQSMNQDGSRNGVYRRVYDNTGTPISSIFRCNSATAGNQIRPKVSMAADGSFVAVWMTENQDGDGYGIYARRFSATGAALASDFQVNDSTAGYQGYPDVAVAANGDFVICWQSNGTDGSGNGIYAKRYDATGAAIGGQFLVNTTTAGNQQEPSITARTNGEFCVVWSSYGQDGNEYGVYAQLYNASGSVIKPEFLINTTTAGNQGHADISAGFGNRYYISWTDDAGDANRAGVFFTSLSSNGTQSSTTLVNNRQTDYQMLSVVAGINNNAMQIVFQDGLERGTSTHDGDRYGIYSRMIESIVPTFDTLNPTVCGTTYTAPSGAMFSSSGTYFDTLLSVGSFDSVYYTINLTLDPLPTVLANASLGLNLCTGDSLLLYGSGANSYAWTGGITDSVSFVPASSGNYIVTGTDGNGCSAMDTIAIVVNATSSATINQTACDSYISPSTNYTWTTSGTYMDTITNAAGCDSVITVNLTINNSTSAAISPTACDSYTSPSTNYTWTTSGTYMDTITNAVGCDSVITVNLTINNSTSATISPTACDSYTSPSTNYVWTTSGTYMDTIANTAGCDSVITINLTVNNSSSATISPTTCDTYTSPSTNYTWTTSGTYMDTITNAAGCDSVITVNLTINNSTSATISPTVCDSYTSPSTNYTWTTSGTYLDTLTNAAGCDSVITVNLTVNNSSSATINPTACDSYTSPSTNYTWTTSGTYMDTIANATGCDSVITVNLTINNSTSSSISPTACDSYTSPSSNYTWTTSGTYMDTIANAAGCDSVITINLTINNSTSATINPTACDSYTSPSTNYTWTTSGTYMDTIMNAASCDSVLTINLTINNSTSATINPTVCDSYTSPSTNYTWTTSGIYMDTLTNAVGCDSVITINLTVNNSTSSTINPTACNSYTSPSTNYTWTTSGTYMDTITNAAGCDSVITINLTINNFTFNTISATACDSYTSPSTNYTWTTSGMYMDTIVNASGCDSVLTVNLTINNSTSATISPVACDSYTSPSTNYTWTTSGTYMDTLTNAAGCDSIITINLTINNSPVITITPNTLATCSTSSSQLVASGALVYQWMPGAVSGSTLLLPPTATSGVYTVTGLDITGCTSTASISVTVNNPNGDLSQASVGNSASTPGTQIDTVVQPNDGQTYSYFDTGCNIIASIQEAAGGISLGSVSSMVTVEPTVPSYNGQPYVARWYDIVPQNSGPATITLYYTDDDFIDYNASSGSFPTIPTNAGAATVATNLAITKTNGPLGTGTPEVINVVANWNASEARWEVTFPVTGFSQFRLHTQNPGGAALPIDLTAFTVEKLTTSDLAKWTTASEMNNSHFNVQRSADGIHFETLGTRSTKALNGNSAEPLNYTYEAEQPLIGHNYYRLEQVDQDNNKSYSRIVDILWTDGQVISLYPNPTKDYVHIDYSLSARMQTEIKLIDMSGRVVKSILSIGDKGMNHSKISMNDLANGIYHIELLQNGVSVYNGKVRKQ